MRVDILLILILTAIHTLCLCKKLPDINNILNQYAAVCGIHFCNVSTVSLPYFHDNLTNLQSFCSPCFCNRCVLNMNCCPEIGLHLSHSKCENKFAYNPLNEMSDFYFTVVDRCPTTADRNAVQLCQNTTNLSEMLTLTPVTVSSGVTYRNVYCAECNGETDFQEWTLDIKCDEIVDFNFLSSFEEIADLIKMKLCTVSYNHLDLSYSVQKCEPIMRNNLIGQCNVTGTWSTYDYDIDWACNGFQLPFEIYKNVFCFICNPPLTDQDIITSTCNQTGDWLEKTDAIENACLMYNESSATLPFKNMFCRYCNIKEGYYEFNDITGIFWIYSENDNSQLSYMMANGKFTEDFIVQYLENTVTNNYSYSHDRLNSSYIFYDGDRKVDTLHLMNSYASEYRNSLCGIYNSDRIPPPYNCACVQYCLASRTCCIDVELDHHWTCYNGFVIANTCRYSNAELNSQCNKRGELMYDIPVYTHVTQSHYSNVFCAFCADDYLKSTPPSVHEILPWGVKITCSIQKSIPFHFQLSMSDVIESAEQNDCIVTFEPDIKQTIVCDDTSTTINICNISGTWISQDADILWACERLNTRYLTSFYGFRNVFCHLCNPGVELRPPPLTTTTSVAPTRTTTAALTRTTTSSPAGCSTCITDKTNIITYRRLFQISYDDEDVISQCLKDQVLDTLQNKCRNVTCSGGYMFVNSSCEPLLWKTNNLGYIVPLRLVSSSGGINPVVQQEFLESIVHSLKNFFEQYLKLNRYLDFTSINMVTNIPCDRNEYLETEMFANVELFIEENVVRKEIETSLMNIRNERISISIYDDDIGLTLTLDERAMNTRTMINNKAQFAGFCYLSKTDYYHTRSHDYYIFNPVSELMVCKQVALENNEITTDETASIVRFKSNGIEVKSGKFKLGTDGTARICVSTLQSLTMPTTQTDPIIGMLIFVTTVVSMACLFMTFFTYCMFPSLRSVPGKNNLSLVFSLFFLQTMLILGSRMSANDIACKVFGILLHYFLLSSFSCLSVCTFHMVKAFSSIKVPHTTDHDTRTVLYYNVYAYCLPAIIITVNISATMSLSDNIGYGNRGGICFITYPYVVIGSVIVPTSIICLCNIAFFLVTLYKIGTIPKIERSSSHNTVHHNSVVYIKLFSITGITWILQIADAFFPVTYLSVIASLFNSLQGVYIFLSYICNNRVLMMYKQLCRYYQEEPESTSSNLTTSSPMTSTRGLKYLPSPKPKIKTTIA